MLIGSVSEEGNQMSSRPTEQEWHANLAKTYGEDKATAIVNALKKAYPDKRIQTLSYMCSGRPGLNGLSMRNNVVKMAKFKHDLHAAPLTRTISLGKPLCSTVSLAHGIRQSYNSASITRSAAKEACNEDGFFLGGVCGQWQTQCARHRMETLQPRDESDHDLGQRLPDDK